MECSLYEAACIDAVDALQMCLQKYFFISLGTGFFRFFELFGHPEKNVVAFVKFIIT